ncbi:MAG: tyrosine-type recombinase/integrase [Pseudomonadota bacterium]|nr:tyrosine-type recombinase/integrase [Pseudomonadota bacterium]
MSDTDLRHPMPIAQTADSVAHGLFSATSDDAQAVAIWLTVRATRSSHTYDAYQRESQRLLVWLAEQSLGLQQMHLDDLHRYYRHLQYPPAHWLRPRKPKQGQALLQTQLLIGGLSASSLDYTRRVLGLLFDYLHQAGYIARNLVRLSQRPAMQQAQQVLPQRFLNLEEWQWLWRWINARPRHTALSDARFMRDRWLILLLYQTGLRRDEVARARMADFRRQSDGWILQVVGKGRKCREITIHADVMAELAIYRTWLGCLSPEPQPNEQIPVVAALSQQSGLRFLTARAIGLVIQQIGTQAAAECPDPQMAQTLQQLSTHWLRHTNATHRLLAGASLETTQDELGHSDPKTTRLYVHTLAEQRRQDVEHLQKLMPKILKNP